MTLRQGDIRLHCTLAEFEKLSIPPWQARFLPGTSGYSGYDPEQVLVMPYYNIGMADAYCGPMTVTYNAVPFDEVQVHRGEHLHATDGHIGPVQGLIIDPDSHHVTHVLLREGHLWGRKEVAIPIGAVTGLDDGIRLNLTNGRSRTCRRWTLVTRMGKPARLPWSTGAPVPRRRPAVFPVMARATGARNSSR